MIRNKKALENYQKCRESFKCSEECNFHMNEDDYPNCNSKRKCKTICISSKCRRKICAMYREIQADKLKKQCKKLHKCNIECKRWAYPEDGPNAEKPCSWLCGGCE